MYTLEDREKISEKVSYWGDWFFIVFYGYLGLWIVVAIIGDLLGTGWRLPWIGDL